MSQSSLNWEIEIFWKLSEVDNAISCFQILFRIAQHDLSLNLPEKIAQNDPKAGPKKLLKVAQNGSKWFRKLQDGPTSV